MTDAVQFFLIGLGLAGVYGLAALGLVVVYRGSGVVNFAHGGIALVGATVTNELRGDLGTWPAVAAGVLAGAAIGALIEVGVMRRMRDASAASRLIATLAMLTILQQSVLLLKGESTQFIAPILPTGTIDFGGSITLGVDRAIMFGVLVVAAGLLWVGLTRTRPGLSVTAVAENRRAAAALGHDPSLVALATWTLGGALAASAGILITPLTGLSPVATTLIVIPALAAALVGRLVSLPGTVIGALVIGVGEAEATRFITAPGWSTSVPFLVILLILLVRTDVVPSRSKVLEQFPRVGGSMERPWLWGIFAAVVLVSVLTLSTEWTAAVVLSLATALIALSVVVLTGYAGQLSLAQYAIAGVAALVAGRMVDGLGASFAPSFVAGVCASALTGLVVGAPALRTRGTTLAIATLGVGVVISSVVFANPDYTGGPISGTLLPAPSVAGLNVSFVEHPQRYAIMCLIVLTVAAFMVRNLRRSLVGRRLLAIRANERAVSTLGISVTRVKLYAFVFSSALAGAGGILLAFRNTRLDYDAFSFFASNEVVLLTVLGSVGFLAGGLAGGALVASGVVQYLVSQVTDVSKYSLLASAVVLLLVLVAAPDGIVAALLARYRRSRRQGTTTAAVPVPEISETEAGGRRGRDRGALRLRGVRVRFGGNVALDGVDLEVPPGHVVGLIGPNGAGKSTLIDAATGMLGRYEGTVSLGDDVLDRRGATARAQSGLGRSFQSLELFEDMTVLDNMRVASEAHGPSGYLRALVAPATPALSASTWDAIQELGLVNHLALLPRELAYAERRLLAVARSVALEPDVLLLDEPAAGLDGADREHLATVIRKLATERGLGVLLVEHDVEMVMSVCDTVAVMDHGRIIATGPPEAVRRDPVVIAAYLGAPVAMPAHDAAGTSVVTKEEVS